MTQSNLAMNKRKFTVPEFRTALSLAITKGILQVAVTEEESKNPTGKRTRKLKQLLSGIAEILQDFPFPDHREFQILAQEFTSTVAGIFDAKIEAAYLEREGWVKLVLRDEKTGRMKKATWHRYSASGSEMLAAELQILLGEDSSL